MYNPLLFFFSFFLLWTVSCSVPFFLYCLVPSLLLVHQVFYCKQKTLQTERNLLFVVIKTVSLKLMTLPTYRSYIQPETSLYEHAQAHTSIWVWVSPFRGNALPPQDAMNTNFVFLWSTVSWRYRQWYLGLLAGVRRVLAHYVAVPVS